MENENFPINTWMMFAIIKRNSKMPAIIKLGILPFTHKIANRLRKTTHIELFYHLSARLSDITAPVPKIEVEIKEISVEDHEILEEMAKIESINYTKEQLLQFLGEGRRCYIALHNGQIASFYWVLRKKFTYRRTFYLADDEEYQLSGYAYPDFRGMGINPYLVAVTARERYQNGPNMLVISHVGVTNKSSLRTVHKLGFRKDGLVGFFDFLGFRLHFIFGRKVLPKTRNRFYSEKI